jgi:hypothetical protein
MDKDLRLKKIMFKDIIKKDDLGKVFIDNDVANVIKEAGFVIMTDELSKKFLNESLELSKLKVKWENEKNGNNS